MVGCVAWVDVFGRGSCSEVEGAESDETTSNFLLGRVVIVVAMTYLVSWALVSAS